MLACEKGEDMTREDAQRSGTWVKVGALEEFSEGEACRVEVEGRALVVVRQGDRFYCLEDCCSHEEYPLSEGLVDLEERTIECAKHGSTFDLSTGEPYTLPATRPVPTFRTKVEAGEVFVMVEDA
jgi:3-phenylpropionate/trans-cinnamate dioxygenase ferredoxin subunit